MSERTRIGEIGNYYGSLEVFADDNKYYWGIENWSGTNWEEIPESLYLELIKFEKDGIKYGTNN